MEGGSYLVGRHVGGCDRRHEVQGPRLGFARRQVQPAVRELGEPEPDRQARAIAHQVRNELVLVRRSTRLLGPDPARPARCKHSVPWKRATFSTDLARPGAADADQRGKGREQIVRHRHLGAVGRRERHLRRFARGRGILSQRATLPRIVSPRAPARAVRRAGQGRPMVRLRTLALAVQCSKTESQCAVRRL